ncbi:MAG: hypothetical protein HXX09_11935 [Bacteroidetes bacterium]|nr:hypothetical protein [Bacteroidota bacterium]
MKKDFFILILAISLFSSCKYEDGPAISFRSFDKRLTGKEWVVENYIIDDCDSIKLFNDSCGCSYSFYHPGTSEIELRTFKNGQQIGRSSVEIQDKKIVKLVACTYCNNKGPLCRFDNSYSLIITRLSDDELWLKTSLDNKNYFIKLKELK